MNAGRRDVWEEIRPQPTVKVVIFPLRRLERLPAAFKGVQIEEGLHN